MKEGSAYLPDESLCCRTRDNTKVYWRPGPPSGGREFGGQPRAPRLRTPVRNHASPGPPTLHISHSVLIPQGPPEGAPLIKLPIPPSSSVSHPFLNAAPLLAETAPPPVPIRHQARPAYHQPANMRHPPSSRRHGNESRSFPRPRCQPAPRRGLVVPTHRKHPSGYPPPPPARVPASRPGRLDRFLHAHPMVDQIRQRLHHRREDAQAAGQAQCIDRLTVPRHDHRRHRRSDALAGCHRARPSRMRIEHKHVVVRDHACTRNDIACAK